MIEYNKEYFSNNYYFLLKEGYDKISLFYSVAETLSESRKSDNKILRRLSKYAYIIRQRRSLKMDFFIYFYWR